MKTVAEMSAEEIKAAEKRARRIDAQNERDSREAKRNRAAARRVSAWRKKL